MPYRQDNGPQNCKRVKKLNTLKIFNKNKSVFSLWKPDTEYSLKKAFEIDMSHAKVDKLIKDPDLCKSTKEVLYKYYEKLK